MVGMATSPSKPCFGGFLPIRPSSRDTYMDCRINMASSGTSRARKSGAEGHKRDKGDVGSSDKASLLQKLKVLDKNYILALIQGIASTSAFEIFRRSILTLATAGEDFFRPPSSNVAGKVSSMKSAAWSRTSSMKDMRSGRSLSSTLPAWDRVLSAGSVCSDGELTRDSSAGWAGNSLTCNGSRRTRLPKGAIIDLKSAVKSERKDRNRMKII